MRGILLCILSFSLVSAQVKAAACWEAEEYEAARMRVLQTVLMVSALKCGRSMPDMPAAYNRWVGRAKASLIEGEKKLLAHFVREGDRLKYDKFTTALANKYSEYAEHSRFCERAKLLMDADEKHNGVLAEVALLLNSRPNGVEDMCPAKKPAGSQIIVSPFDPIPEGGAAQDAPGQPVVAGEPAAVAAPATETAAAIPAGTVSAPPQ